MQFQFKINVGETEVTIVENAETQSEFVEKISFYSGLPTEGPNGEKDLKFVFRTTQQGYKYYSIVSEKAGQEYNFGQSQKVPGELFGKGWEPVYNAENSQQNVQPQQNQGGVGVQSQVNQNVQPQQNLGGVGIQQQVNQNVQPQPNAVAQQVTNQNQQVANDVLQKFGITQ